MKVIIPLAGKGTRLRPHTHVTPKPMLKVAGRPVMSYVMDDVMKLGNVEQTIYITGHLKEKVEEYVRANYSIPSVFIEQEVQDGTAGAVALARAHVDQPVLIIFVDTIFDADLSVTKTSEADGIIWVKEVEDYQRFGVVVTDADGYMTRIVEKPKEPISKRANIGLYYIRNWKLLYEGIDHVLASAQEQGRVVSHGRLPVHDRQGCEDQGRGCRRLVRCRTARDVARHESHDAAEGTRTEAGVAGRRAQRSWSRCTSKTAAPSRTALSDPTFARCRKPRARQSHHRCGDRREDHDHGLHAASRVHR